MDNNTYSDAANVTTWVSAPNQRGTMDIIWSSFFTIFLCTWTTMCLNIPPPNESNIKTLRRRLRWMFMAITYPEAVFALSITQYASAKQSVQLFRDLGHTDWTLKHGFFADMGGFLLEPLDGTPFAITAHQLAKLVERQCVEYPNITAEEIWDKSKADALSKCLSLLQASWLLFQLLGRAILRLPTSTLELTTSAIVVCTFGTFLCWLHKPSDVQKGFVLSANATTGSILSQADGVLAEPYKSTVADSIRYGIAIGCYNKSESTETQFSGLLHFSNNRVNISAIGDYYLPAIFIANLIFASISMVAWHFTFPTRMEALLWRISSVVAISVLVFTWIVEVAMIRLENGHWRIANGGSKPLPIWWVILKTPLLVLNLAARWFTIVESLVGLRRLPIGVFRIFDVAQVVPHF
ncbi:hypothetical protein GGR53DRAFT_46889 [Hypoxylon sp. FL1150]|nr:hypothetical protein GGR53DRAFT_46889 [Hypoxylon sp. FL1150]